MNFKERGITVGDLLSLIILIIIISFVSFKFKAKKQQTALMNQSIVSNYLILKR